MTTPLDNYEEQLQAFLNTGKYNSAKNFAQIKKMLEEAAKRHLELQESKSITLRVAKKDLISIKAKAKQNNIPYQTLINLLINRYAQGKSHLAI